MVVITIGLAGSICKLLFVCIYVYLPVVCSQYFLFVSIYVSVCRAFVVAWMFSMYSFHLFSAQVSLDSVVDVSVDR